MRYAAISTNVRRTVIPWFACLGANEEILLCFVDVWKGFSGW